jgi:hypothetical protein
MILPREIPVEPDAPEAAEWLITELSKPEYQAARPTLFDRIAQAIAEWLASLQIGSVEGPPALGFAIVIALVLVGLIVAFLVFGVPRLNRRSAATGALFGDDDARTAAMLRREAEDAAGRGDYSAAVADLFRCIARGLAERTIVTTSPGTTARDFARHSGQQFPDLSTDLVDAAVMFDAVRYLGREGTPEQYAALATLEGRLRATRPTLEPVAT